MATIVPVAVTFFAVFVLIGSVPGNTNECTFSNIEVLSYFIDARINATVAAIVAEFTATLEERITTTVNATIDALNVTVNEKVRAVSTTVSALQITAARLSNQPGKVCSVHHNTVEVMGDIYLCKGSSHELVNL